MITLSDILPRVSKESSSILGRGQCHECHETFRSNIHVVVRIRPKNFNEKGSAHRTIVKAMGERVVIFDPKENSDEDFYFHGIKQKVRHDYTKKPNKNLKFAYDRVYGPQNTNNEIFETSVKKLVSHIIDGFNCSIFAYGATGAGKTYTMLGSFEHPGLTFLMAMELYNRINGMANEYESEIVVSYLEVYNETLRDLLHPSGILSIREDGFGVNIPNLTIHKPKDASELLGMLSYGNSCRTQHPTDHNAESSRSHAVFQVAVSLRKRFTHKSLKYKMAKAKLVMVDLAGSERGLGSGCDSQRCREGASINKSLLALSNCINALADGKKHIPYRDSKLTRILKDSLGGNCKTVMIANVSPSQLNYDDTYNTLKYAGRAKEIRINCKKKFCTTDLGIMTYSKVVDDLQLEIQQLKTELQNERDARKKQMQSDKLPDLPLPQMTMTMSSDRNDMNNCHLAYDSPSQISSSSLITPTQVIPDPIALENFIQLVSQRKKLEEDHAEASIASKELEWNLQWKRWKLEAAKFAAGFSSKQRNFRSTFGNGLQQMKSQYDNYLSRHKDLMDKVHLAKKNLDFNEKEIDLVGGNSLIKLTMEEPFLTVTLREFLYYKSLERQVSTNKSLENYHQKMTLNMFQELISTETMFGNCLKFQNYIYQCLQDRNGITEYIEAKQKEILSPLYDGDISLKVSSTKLDGPEFPPTQLLQELWEFMRNPVVEYETTPDSLTDEADGWNDGQHSENEGSSEDIQCSAIQSISTDTVHDEVALVHLEESNQSSTVSIVTEASSSNDVLTLHHSQKYMSVESLFDRGVNLTARTIPFSAVASDESVVMDDANNKTRATTATDFEEAIKYSNCDLLQYMDSEMKHENKRVNKPKPNNTCLVNDTKTVRPTTTIVTKGQSPYYCPNLIVESIPSNDDYSQNDLHLQHVESRTIVYDHAQVQVSEADLLTRNPRPLTFCYPNNYNTNRSFPLYPGQGDR